MTTFNAPPTTFSINYMFDGSKDAIDAFSQLRNIYETFYQFDKAILNCFPEKYISEYNLIGIEYGSLKTMMVQVLKGIPDDVIKDPGWKSIVGWILIKAKLWAIKKLEDNIDTKEQVQEVTNNINNELTNAVQEVGVIINTITIYPVLNFLGDMANQTNKLKDNERLEYLSFAGNAYLKKGVFVNKNKILTELGEHTITNDTTEVLKIKKVPMLSLQAKWDFLNHTRSLAAKIADSEWLQEFHDRKVIIKPEDSLMVTLRATHTFSPNFQKQQTEYEVLKVIGVISPGNDSAIQASIFNSPPI